MPTRTPSRPSTTRTRRSDPPRASAAGQWLVLLVLIAAVVVSSAGLGGVQAALDAVRGLFYTRPPSAGVSAPPAVPDGALQARVEAAAGLPTGTLGAMVVDLDNGATASVNAEREFPAASLFKLPILVEVLAQEAAGLLPADRLLEIGADDWTGGSGVLQARVGEQLPVRELTRLMIQESDNIAALVLLDAVGAANVNRRMDQLELHRTRVIDFRAGERGEHVTTPSDMAQFLSLMAQGRLVDARVSEEAVRLLELRQAQNWLGEGLPWWVKIAHKWGDLPEARHDAGLILTPSGNHVVAVLSEGASPEDAQRAISRVSQAAFEHLR